MGTLKETIQMGYSVNEGYDVFLKINGRRGAAVQADLTSDQLAWVVSKLATLVQDKYKITVEKKKSNE